MSRSCVLASVLLLLLEIPAAAQQTPRLVVSLPERQAAEPLDGRLLLMVSSEPGAEPRFQISDGPGTQQIFGADVEGWLPGEERVLDASALGFPLRSVAEVPAGRYRIQALLNRYETHRLHDGRVLKLPPDRGEGQQWNRKPGNLYSDPVEVDWDPARGTALRVALTREIPSIPDPPSSKYVRHERIQSRLLSEFWGRPVYLGAHVLLPEGFDEHPEARYPLAVMHGHFPSDFGGWRETPPDTSEPCRPSARFGLPCYNRTEQELAYQFFREWTSPDFPVRALVVEIQHANPYYDDSYAVNSANLGPYGDAITHELIPYLERKYRGIGEGWARVLYGGSTGGWEAMAAQVFYPDEYNGAFIACPDPIDFRQFTLIDLYADRNAYYVEGPWKRTPRPGRRNWLGQVDVTLEEMNRLELVLGTRTRSGQQWDVWEAVFSPVGPDGYPARIWDKETGVIDPAVAAYWRENFDLSHILRRDWGAGLGEKLRGKLHIYVGDMDNYYLNNAVYLVEDFLERTTDPPYEGEVDYGDRAEHCWNGDHGNPNAVSRLRYHQMFVPRILEQVRRNAPAGADTLSWRYRR